MKKWLVEMLLCPECLKEKEIPLQLAIEEERDDDVLEGKLECPACGRCYPIKGGVAVVLPEKSMALCGEGAGYNSRGMLSSYLWSHYCEFFDAPEATDAYGIWSSYFRKTDGCALDIGCSVGRLSFELSRTHSRVVGIDTSLSFIQKARELAARKKLDFELIVEGRITESHSCEFDGRWDYDRVEFIVADALALPFPESCFATATSVNLLEKVENPIRHLADINRVLAKARSMFVFSDPFSWDPSFSDARLWLGGKATGRYSGRGMDNMRDLFSGRDKVLDPPFEILDDGSVSWKIRKTENLWEHINSQFIIGTRS